MPRYSEQDARDAIAISQSYSEALRHLGMRPAGGNGATLKRWAERWGISTEHFDRHASQREQLRALGAARTRPLEQILVEGSTYSRSALKRRLFKEGVKERRCELCGQGEIWHGRPMALILDHVNGVADDHRLENLQIVCPNCAATLETHCGRNKTRKFATRECEICGNTYRPYGQAQRFCSVACSGEAIAGVPRPERRRVERPPVAQLLAEIEAMGYSAVGRRYGVSDNAIRKWVRAYAKEREAAGDDLDLAA